MRSPGFQYGSVLNILRDVNCCLAAQCLVQYIFNIICCILPQVAYTQFANEPVAEASLGQDPQAVLERRGDKNKCIDTELPT